MTSEPEPLFALEVCRMRAEEVLEVASLAARCFAGGAWTAEDLRQELVRPFAEVWVARPSAAADEPEAIVGFAVAWFIADDAELLTIGTDPDRRDRGIGRALVQRVQRSSEERAVRSLTLEVRCGNAPARALYERSGFETSHVRRRYYADGEDALVMAWCPPRGTSAPRTA